MKVVELFAGVGGFRLGLERAGHEVVWANEWDKYAATTYDKNFGGSIDRRDITTIPAGDVPAHDLIVGGFPCQSFSVAGKRRGFDEVRGTLFFDIARIVAYHKTKYLLLENVKGLLNHDRGHTFTTIVRALDELGYDLQWQVLNSKNFGVPQNRERIIIVGHLRGESRPEVFPIGENDRFSDEAAAREQGRHIAGTLTVRNASGNNARGTYIKQLNPGVPQDYRLYDTTGIAPTINPAAAVGGAVIPKINTLPMRKLTPVECERLQGFPDNWTQGVSDTQRYKQMGNAVTVNVIEAVARMLPAPQSTGEQR